jgi:hypothetical protein
VSSTVACAWMSPSSILGIKILIVLSWATDSCMTFYYHCMSLRKLGMSQTKFITFPPTIPQPTPLPLFLICLSVPPLS